MPEQHQLLSTRQAATLLGVSVRTVQLWVEQGLLSAWKTPGGHRRILQESLLGLLHKRQSGSPQALAICVDLDEDFFTSLQNITAQFSLPIQLQQARNIVDALLMLGERKAELIIISANQQGTDLSILQQELMQHRVKLALFSAQRPLFEQQEELIWLRLPLDAVQFKTEIQKVLLSQIQKLSAVQK